MEGQIAYQEQGVCDDKGGALEAVITPQRDVLVQVPLYVPSRRHLPDYTPHVVSPGPHH